MPAVHVKWAFCFRFPGFEISRFVEMRKSCAIVNFSTPEKFSDAFDGTDPKRFSGCDAVEGRIAFERFAHGEIRVEKQGNRKNPPAGRCRGSATFANAGETATRVGGNVR